MTNYAHAYSHFNLTKFHHFLIHLKREATHARAHAHTHTRIKYFKPRFIMLENFWRQYFASILHELSYFGEILHELRKAVCKVRAGKVCRIKKPWSKIFYEKCLKKSCYLSMPMRKLFLSPPTTTKPTYTDSYNFTLNKKSNRLLKYIKNRTQNLSLSHTHAYILIVTMALSRLKMGVIFF